MMKAFFLSILLLVFSSSSLAKKWGPNHGLEKDARDLVRLSKKYQNSPRKFIREGLSHRPKSVQDFFIKEFKNNEIKKIPAIHFENNTYSFSIKNKKVEMRVLSYQEHRYSLNGYEFQWDFRKPIQENTKYLQRIARKTMGQKFSILDFFLPKAWADEDKRTEIKVSLKASYLATWGKPYADLLATELQKVSPRISEAQISCTKKLPKLNVTTTRTVSEKEVSGDHEFCQDKELGQIVVKERNTIQLTQKETVCSASTLKDYFCGYKGSWERQTGHINGLNCFWTEENTKKKLSFSERKISSHSLNLPYPDDKQDEKNWSIALDYAVACCKASGCPETFNERNSEISLSRSKDAK